MNIRLWLLVGAMVIGTQSATVLAASAGDIWGADGQSEVSNVWAFLREVDRTMLLAEEGGYGEISDEDQYRVSEAGRTIRTLLGGRTSTGHLDGSQRQALNDARRVIGTVLRSADKEREVCLPAMITGSRLPREECLTVEEREDRAYYQRERRWPRS